MILIKKEIIKTCNLFETIKAEWCDLFKKTDENPFLSYGWISTWWKVYGHGELFVIVFRLSTNNKLVGILPLYKTEVGFFFKVRLLKFMGSTNVSGDYLDCLVDPCYVTDVFQACVDALEKVQNQYDLVTLRDMDKGSSFLHYIQQSKLKTFLWENSENVCPYKLLPATWDELTSVWSKSRKQFYRRKNKTLEKLGDIEFEQIKDADSLSDAYADMLRLRKDRMDQKGFSADKVNSNYQAFNSEIIELFFADDTLRLFFLKVNKQRVAYFYLFSGGSTLYFYQTGFDRNWQKYSVGFVLLGKVFDYAIKEGYPTFDFLRGREKYKYEWNVDGERQLVDITLGNKSLLSRMLLFLLKVKCRLLSIKRVPVHQSIIRGTGGVQLWLPRLINSVKQETVRAGNVWWRTKL